MSCPARPLTPWSLVATALVLLATPMAPPACAAEPPDGWQVRLSASRAGLVDRGALTLGASSTTLDGFDVFDDPHPPSWPSRYLEVLTRHDVAENGWAGQPQAVTRYRRQFDAPLGAAARSIDFAVYTDQAGPVALTWSLVPDLELAQHFVTLVDVESAASVDLWAVARYDFTALAGTHRFRLELVPGRSAPPIAQSQTVTLSEDSAGAAIALTALDPEGDPLTFEIAQPPAHGTLLGSAPNVTYVPAPNFNGSDSFSFLARDATNPSNEAVVTLAVEPVNDAPTASDASYTTAEDTPLALNLQASDVDADPLSFEIVDPPAHGTLSGTAPNLVYTPAPDYFGLDAFTFRASDGLLVSSPASVSLTITSVNDTPLPDYGVAGPAWNVAQWQSNLASYFEGANIVEASSVAASNNPVNAIDDSPSTRWISATGQVASQYITVALARGELASFDRVRLYAAPGSGGQSVKRFQVLGSTTGVAAGDFSLLLDDVALDNTRVQEFVLPSPATARYVRLLALDNWGSTCCVSVGSFELVDSRREGVPSHLTTPANVAAASEAARVDSVTSQFSASFAAALAIDGSTGTRWASAQRDNQALVLELARGKVWTIDRVRLVNPGSSTESTRNFEIAVSATTNDPAAFTSVLSATALANTNVQEFLFPGGPVAARYLRLRPLTNNGSACCVSISEIQAIPVPPTPSPTSFSSYSDQNSRPELLLDTSPTTPWLTASGQVTDQFVVLRVAAGGDEAIVERVRLQAWTSAIGDAMKDFEIWLSSESPTSGFVRVLAATLLNNGLAQDFVLPGAPVRTRFLRLVAKNNYGSTSNIRLATLELRTPGSQGNIVTLPATSVASVLRNESPAQTANGAVVTQVSSGSPASILDYSGSGAWATSGAFANQFLVVQLAGTATGTRLLEGVRLAPRYDCCTTESLKDFEIWVSETTNTPAAYTRVLTATVLNNAALQTFSFPAPVAARFVKLVPLNTYGSTTTISTSNFDVLASDAGGVVEVTSAGNINQRADLALDLNTGTLWQTPSGAATNQSLKVRLAGGSLRQLYGVRIFSNGSSGPKDVEIRVSATTADDAAFTTVATATLPSTVAWQYVPFTAPVNARFVQFIWKNGYNASFIGVWELEALEVPATGAVVHSFTSQFNTTTTPEQALALQPSNNVGWASATNQIANQSLKIILPRAATWNVDRAMLIPRSDCCQDQAVRNFEVQLSTTTLDDAAFTTVVAGVLRNDGSLQAFPFPAQPARFVRLVMKDSSGSTSNVTVRSFWVISSEIGAADAYFLDRSRDPDGTPAAFGWTFGDGSQAATRDSQHVFPGAGVFSVEHAVTDDAGGTSSVARRFEVFGAAQANLSFTPAAPNEGQSVTFTDTSTDSAGGIVLRTWDWGDGTAQTFNVASTSHTYADNGTYTVTLTVTNARGITSSVTRSVVVANLAPTADAGADRTIVWSQDWGVLASVNDAGTVDRNTLVCTWDLGDGSPLQTINNCNSSNVRVARQYANPGTYTATLTVRDKDGAVATDTLVVTVNKRQTFLALVKAINSDALGNVTIVAKLADRFALTNPMIGKSVSFTLGAQSVTGTVDLDGLASGTLLFAPGVVNAVTANFAGDAFYLGASATGAFNPVLVFPGLPSIRHDKSNFVAFVPNESGRQPNGGQLSNFGFSGGFAPVFAIIDPFDVGNATKPNPLPAFDTVALNGICDIGSTNFLGNATFRDRLRDFVVGGGKLVIWDSECTNTDYSRFFLPFTTNNPGALGANGTLQIVEENTLSSANVASPYFIDVAKVGSQTDAVGDSNVFLTFDPNWCVDMTAKNAVLPEFKPVHTYSVLGQGVIVYNGLDRDAMTLNAAASPGTGTFFLAKIWEQELKQAWNPSGLPCDVAAAQATIELVPPTAVQDVGQTHTVTATVRGQTGNPLPSVVVTFDVTGVHPRSQIVTADTNGQATLTYTGTLPGDDQLRARAGAIASNQVSVHWNAPPVANAGPDRSVPAEAPALLDGRASSDPNPADVLSFAWTQLSGPPVALTDANTAQPSFTPITPADYVFQLTVSDGRLNSSDTVTITVTPVNHPPAASDQALTTPEDTALALTLGASDPDGDALTYAIVTPPAHGTLSGSGASLTYTPAANYNGPDAFTFVANDGTLDSNVATVSITVTPVNDPPVADDQAVMTPEDTPVAVTLTASDIDGDSLTYTVVTPPTHGTLSGSGASLTYTPASDYHGPDSFTFVANDGTLDSNVATVSITVTPVNDPPVADDQAVMTPEDTPVAVTLTASDIDGDSLTYTVVTPPTHGTLSGSGANLTYTPASDYHGPDSFTFVANDGTVDSNIATVSIVVTPVNDPPVANDQALTTPEDTPVAVTLTASDIDGDSVTYTVVTSPAHGTLSGSGASLTYTPASDYHGPDSFTFVANDGTVDSNVATVSITVTPVNDPPVADDQAATTPEDTPVAVTLTASDIDGDSLAYTVVTPPAHGTLSGSGASLTYTPASDYHGPDSFTFVANDGTVDSNVATVSITVTPVNDPPVANDQAVTTPEDTPVAVTLTASDIDGDSLTYTVVTSPAHGTLSGSGASLTYTPASDYHGPDSFTFVANDGTVDSNVATVSITVTPVNDPPVANDQAVTTPEDTPVAVTLTASDIDGDSLTYTVVTPPAHGTLSGSGANLTYTPAANYHGPDSFTFVANDGSVGSNVATVSITVTPVNDPPVANDQAVTTPFGTPVAITLTASDVDGDSLTYTLVTPPAHGTLSGSGATLVYTPAVGFSGADSFTFQANDGAANSNVATVTITVAPPTDTRVRPILECVRDEGKGRLVAVFGYENPNALPVTIPVGPMNAFSPTPIDRGQPEVFTPGRSPRSGAFLVPFDGNDQTWTLGALSVTAHADSPGCKDEPSTPTAGDDKAWTTEGVPVVVEVLVNDFDPEGDPLKVVRVTQPVNGSVTIAPDGRTVTYTPGPNPPREITFTYTVSDGQFGTAQATVWITINRHPVCTTAYASPSKLWPPNHKYRSISVRGVTDPDGYVPEIVVSEVWQDEPINGLGDGDTSPDARLSPLQVRAERSGTGNGRVYHVRFQAEDPEGGRCTGVATVCVPHDNSPGSVCGDEGPLYSSTGPTGH